MSEAWGRGIEHIMEACRVAGTPEPEVRYETAGLWLVFHYLPEHQGLGKTTEGLGGNRESTPEGLGGTAESLGEGLGETRIAIVRTMLTDPKVTTIELARSLNISTTAVEKHLRRLKALGYIEREGPTKGGQWKVKGAPTWRKLR